MNGNDFKEGVHNLTDAAEVVLEGREENHKQPSQDGDAGRDGVPPKYRNRWLPLHRSARWVVLRPTTHAFM
jgi:hypothetical protein